MYSFVIGPEDSHDDSVDKIHDLEKKYKIKFPEVLVEYYSKCDGNPIILSKITIDGYECEIAKIVPIISDKMSFEDIVDNDRVDGFLPTNFYPIARDRGGDYYYWDSKTEVVYLILVDDYENPFKVSDSINAFFEMIEKSNKN